MFGSNVIGSSALAATALAALTIGAGAARAEVVCNPAGDCWHVHRHETYPEPGYAYHPDDWYFHRSWGGGQYRWHDYHPGRGYWRNGVWVTF